jgi:hypothetical protein
MTKARALEALEARRRGEKLIAIAKRYGVTKQRARQLVVLGTRIEFERSSPDPWYQLNIRIRNALENACPPTPAGVADYFESLEQLKRWPSLGIKSITELQAWLVRHGKEPIPDDRTR